MPFIKYLRILLLTAVCVFYVPFPSFDAQAGEPLTTGKTTEAFNLSAFADKLNPSLIRSLFERLPGFLPLASNKIITIIDFSLPSTAHRLWTINLETGEVLFNTLVAHGRNTGQNIAEKFSNIPQSYQSSLGFYLTDQVYTGKHGHSLRLKGLEKNINDKAWERAIVIHGADYVSESFIKAHGRLGRSHGCPAIPPEITEDFISTTKEGSLLFIYHPGYDQHSGCYDIAGSRKQLLKMVIKPE